MSKPDKQAEAIPDGASKSAPKRRRKKNAEDDISRYVRKQIKVAREAAGMSQTDLGNRLDRNRVSISDVERGRIQVSVSDVAQIARVVEIPISYFFPSDLADPQIDSLSPTERELMRLFRELRAFFPLEELAMKQVADVVKTANYIRAESPQKNLFEYGESDISRRDGVR